MLNLTKSRTKCTLHFKEETIEDFILASADPTEIAYDETVYNNLRYIGENPNNYVSFNNELRRIMGVFNNIDDGTGTKETRLKIIKNEPYNESIAWNSSGQNDWTQASLQQELNGTYLNSIQSPYNACLNENIYNWFGSDLIDCSNNNWLYKDNTMDINSSNNIQ